MWCLTIIVQCLLCVASGEIHSNTENTTGISLVTSSVIQNIPVRFVLEFLETPMLGDSVRIRPNDSQFLLNPSVFYYSGQNRWSPMNINPLHNNTNVYSIYTNNKIVKLFGIEHAYSSPYILMSVLEQEVSQLCIQLRDNNVEYTTCICSAGFTKSSSNVCVACAAGTYKVLTGNMACTICPGNSPSPTGSNSFANCSCPAGTSIYFPNSTKAKSCTPCAANFYRSATDSELCQACEARHFAQPGSSSCSCKPGFQGFPACDVCGIGYFSNMLDNTLDCLQCPGGKIPVMNSASIVNCACPPGSTENSGNVCTPCPPATYQVGAVCISCGGQSNAPQGSTQCSCNKGSIRGTGGICTCDKEYSLISPNTEICQPCPLNSYKPLIGNTPCSPCKINQWSTAQTAQCHCRPGFGTHAQPAVVKASSQFCWGQYELPAAMSGTIDEAPRWFYDTRTCFYEVRAPSAHTTIDFMYIASNVYTQLIYGMDQTTNKAVSTTTINPGSNFIGTGLFPTGYLIVAHKRQVIDEAWIGFYFQWKVLPSFPCNLCNQNMYQNNTGLYSQCHACPDQKTSPPGSTSPLQCS